MQHITRKPPIRTALVAPNCAARDFTRREQWCSRILSLKYSKTLRSRTYAILIRGYTHCHVVCVVLFREKEKNKNTATGVGLPKKGETQPPGNRAHCQVSCINSFSKRNLRYISVRARTGPLLLNASHNTKLKFWLTKLVLTSFGFQNRLFS